MLFIFHQWKIFDPKYLVFLLVSSADNEFQIMFSRDIDEYMFENSGDVQNFFNIRV